MIQKVGSFSWGLGFQLGDEDALPIDCLYIDNLYAFEKEVKQNVGS